MFVRIALKVQWIFLWLIFIIAISWTTGMIWKSLGIINEPKIKAFSQWEKEMFSSAYLTGLFFPFRRSELTCFTFQVVIDFERFCKWLYIFEINIFLGHVELPKIEWNKLCQIIGVMNHWISQVLVYLWFVNNVEIPHFLYVNHSLDKKMEVLIKFLKIVKGYRCC